MGKFISKATEFVTGKTETERKQEETANKIIRQKAFAEQLKVRKEQAIKYAAEKERVTYEKKFKQLRQPAKQRVGMFGAVAPEYKTYGSPFGQPRFVREGRTHTKRIKTKKGKWKKIKVKSQSVPSYKFRETISPRIDVLGTRKWF